MISLWPFSLNGTIDNRFPRRYNLDMNNEEHNFFEAQRLVQKVADEAYYKGYCMGASLYYDALYNGLHVSGPASLLSVTSAYAAFLNLFSGTYMPKMYHQKGLFDE